MARSHLLDDWTPWWLSLHASPVLLRSNGTALVQLLDSDAPAAAAPSGPPSPPPAPLPSLATLLPPSIPPSPLLPSLLADALAAYCLLQRLHQGDWCGDTAPEAAALLLQLSPTLRAAAAGVKGGKGLPSSARGGVQGVIESAARGGPQLGAHARWLRRDAAALTAGGRGAVVCALEHARQLLAAAAMEGAEAAPLRRAERKLFFLAVYANEAGEGLAELAESLGAEAEREEAEEAAAAVAIQRRGAGVGAPR